MRRAALTLGIALVLGATASEAPGVGSTELEKPPRQAALLAGGHLWGAPWKFVAFRTDDGFLCSAVIRGGTRKACTKAPGGPDPALVAAGHSTGGPKPTSFQLILTSTEVATVTVKLDPGGRIVERRIRSLGEHGRRVADLPRDFRFAVIAVPKVRGISVIHAFDTNGNHVGDVEGPGSPLPARG